MNTKILGVRGAVIFGLLAVVCGWGAVVITNGFGVAVSACAMVVFLFLALCAVADGSKRVNSSSTS